MEQRGTIHCWGVGGGIFFPCFQSSAKTDVLLDLQRVWKAMKTRQAPVGPQHLTVGGASLKALTCAKFLALDENPPIHCLHSSK